MGMELWNNTPPQQPEEQVHQVKLPEGTSQQEFFATEVGNVAGRDSMEHIEATVKKMLADKEKSIASIVKKLQENFQIASEKLALQKDLSEQHNKFIAENPKTNAYEEYDANEKYGYKKIISQLENSTKILPDLIKKLGHDSLSHEEILLVSEYLSGDEKILDYMFLMQLNSSQSTDDRLKESKRKIDSMNIA